MRLRWRCLSSSSGACLRQAVCFHTTQCQTLQLLFVLDNQRKLHSWHFFWKYTSPGTIIRQGWDHCSLVHSPKCFRTLHFDYSAAMVLGCFVDIHASVRTAIFIYFEHIAVSTEFALTLSAFSSPAEGSLKPHVALEAKRSTAMNYVRLKRLAFGDLLEVWLAYVLLFSLPSFSWTFGIEHFIRRLKGFAFCYFHASMVWRVV